MIVPNLNVLDLAFRADPHPEYERLRKESPLARLMPFGSLLVLRHHDCRTLLLDPRIGFDKLPEVQPEHPAASYLDMRRRWMLFQNPPRHRELRTPFNDSFRGSAIKEAAPLVKNLAKKCLDPLREEDSFDLVTTAIEPFASQVISDLLGLPETDHNTFIHWTRLIARGLDLSTNLAQNQSNLVQAGQTYRQFHDYFDDKLSTNALNPDAPLARLLLEQTSNGCPHQRKEDLTASVALLAAAGHHTIINTIGLAVHALLSHPEHSTRLHHPQEWPALAIEELLRFTTAANLTRRNVLEPLPFYDLTLQPHTEIWLSLGSANRDETVFKNPHDLNFERKPNPHLSFGQGVHSCIGGTLARLQIKTFLEELSTLSPRLRLNPERPPIPHDNFILHGWQNLYLQTGPNDSC